MPSPRHDSPAPGSQSALRARNRERISEVLSEHGPSTQAELARLSGLSPATVSNIVRQLVSAGEAEKSPTTASGRRAVSVSLTASRAVAVGVDIGRRHVRLVVAAKNRQILGERFSPLPVGHTAERTLALAAREYAGLLEDVSRSMEDVIGIGVGIPGPIDQRTHTVIDGAILPEWVGIDLHPRLEQTFGRPVALENDANLGALGEIAFGRHDGAGSLVYLKVATGIGAGIAVEGQLLSGALGVSGEIGHLGLQASDVVCHCGNRGCLETVASTRAVLEQLRQAGRDASTSEDIVELAQRGDLATLRLLEDSARSVGEACGHIANMLGPEAILLGGPLAPLGRVFLDPMEAAMRRHSVPLIRESVRLEAASLGDQAEALGAVAVVLREM
ncbi:ROK family transcriptional regulator [Arthrobacter sp. UM1]|uniref:ROK family transcriptional regulator n=1 Tax=Arthrobacter sp. UM1 TaxID=2766776 RepID=UPI001CF622E1|nr:ROK family transcriptional regulator [Arthrobacter sp. UM1]MCB4207908.1 ROK family transcriptional regulator [Arthrobacter sp. UM1]